MSSVFDFHGSSDGEVEQQDQVGPEDDSTGPGTPPMSPSEDWQWSQHSFQVQNDHSLSVQSFQGGTGHQRDYDAVDFVNCSDIEPSEIAPIQNSMLCFLKHASCLTLTFTKGKVVGVVGGCFFSSQHLILVMFVHLWLGELSGSLLSI
jgi:hypothetical protein